MKDYSKMTDFEINKAVALALGSFVRKSAFETDYYFTDDEVACNPCAPHGPVEWFKPCNSWADAGPIIENNGIGLTKSGSLWRASRLPGGYFYDERPLRAAMIVFLMMKEKDNE